MLPDFLMMSLQTRSSGPAVKLKTMSCHHPTGSSTSHHLDSSDPLGHVNTGDWCSGAGSWQIVLATNRNGGMIRLKTWRHKSIYKSTVLSVAAAPYKAVESWCDSEASESEGGGRWEQCWVVRWWRQRGCSTHWSVAISSHCLCGPSLTTRHLLFSYYYFYYCSCCCCWSGSESMGGGLKPPDILQNPLPSLLI